MVLVILLIIFGCFFFVIFLGAPYLPTLNTQIENAFNIADIKAGQTIVELGCGDGKVLIAAAKRGINSIGYEINPVLFLIAWFRTLKYRSKVRLVLGNYWNKDWPEADAIFVFLLQKYMKKLDKKCIQYRYKPVKLMSFAFTISGKEAVATQGGIYLYEYK